MERPHDIHANVLIDLLSNSFTELRQNGGGDKATRSEIAATISFLASDGATYITGQSLKVNGGLMRSV